MNPVEKTWSYRIFGDEMSKLRFTLTILCNLITLPLAILGLIAFYWFFGIYLGMGGLE